MIVNSDQSFSDFIIQAKSDYKKHGWLQIKISKGSRTLKQNAWINKAYDMLSRQIEGHSIPYFRNYCKYTFGLPILFADDVELAEAYKSMLCSLSMDKKLKAMELVKVTSEMSPDEASQYIDAIRERFINYELPSKEGLK